MSDLDAPCVHLFGGSFANRSTIDPTCHRALIQARIEDGCPEDGRDV
jgi:hypothetical protein